jgi:hypothetical protein
MIPMAILVGRAVAQARRKHGPQPKIPVHFEDDEDDYEGPKASQEYVKEMAARRIPSKPRRNLAPAPAGISMATASSPPIKAGKGLPEKAPPALAVPDRAAFPQNVARLSPLKQAVVMAEVLGPPKAFRE